MSSPTCYFPDGSENSRLVAATDTDSSGHATCCNAGHYLFSNGLCLDNNENTFYRGGCTDETWASSACPRYCLGVSGGVCGVWACNNNNQFACNYPDCGNSSLMFQVNGGVIQQNAALQAVLPTTTSASSTTITYASGTATTSASSTAITSASSTATTSGSSTPSSTAVSTSSSTTSSSSTSDICPSHVGIYAGLGAGLGISLLVSLAALFFVLLQLRRYRHSTVVGESIDEPSKTQQHKGYSSSSSELHAGYNHQTPRKQELDGWPEAVLLPRAELDSR